MRPKIKNIKSATPARWSQFGAACVGVSTMIAGYGLTMDDKVVGYIGLGIGVVGTFISIMFKEEKE